MRCYHLFNTVSGRPSISVFINDQPENGFKRLWTRSPRTDREIPFFLTSLPMSISVLILILRTQNPNMQQRLKEVYSCFFFNGDFYFNKLSLLHKKVYDKTDEYRFIVSKSIILLQPIIILPLSTLLCLFFVKF